MSNQAEAVLTVLDPNANADPGQAETIPVYVSSDTDPRGIAITVRETGMSSGLFTSTAAGRNLYFCWLCTVRNQGEGMLRVSDGDELTAFYSDPVHPDCCRDTARWYLAQAPVTPTPTLAPLPPPTETPAITSAPAPELESPEDEAAFGPQDRIALVWTWKRQLGARDFFTVRMWREGELPETLASLKDEQLIVDMTQRDSGVYYWNVAVARLQEDQTWTIISGDSEVRSFLLLPPRPPTPPVGPTQTPLIFIPTLTPTSHG